MNPEEKLPDIEGEMLPAWAQAKPVEPVPVGVETEKKGETGIPELPVSPLVAEADKIYREKGQIEREIRQKAFEYEQKLLAEHPIYKNLDKKWSKALKDAKADTRNNLRNFIEKASSGEYGRGELVVVHSHGDFRLARVIPFKNHSKQPLDIDIKDNTVEDYDLLNKEKIEGKTYGNPEVSTRFAEISMDGTSESEYDRLFDLLRKECALDDLVRLFPKDYKLKVKAGEVFNYGGASHHSGDIYAYAMVLPTGRLAVFSDYRGENEDLYGTKRFWGIVPDPSFEPKWSAKYGGLQNQEDISEFIPTNEEIEFLKKKKMPVDKTDSKMLSEGDSNKAAQI